MTRGLLAFAFAFGIAAMLVVPAMLLFALPRNAW